MATSWIKYWWPHQILTYFWFWHIIPFLLVTCLWNLLSLCLSCWILCSYKYLHKLSLMKINAVDSERTFLFFAEFITLLDSTSIQPFKKKVKPGLYKVERIFTRQTGYKHTKVVQANKPKQQQTLSHTCFSIPCIHMF